jgi:hypothetical protein
VAKAIRSAGDDKCGRLGDIVLLAVVGLLEVVLDDDDPLQAEHLELQVGVVGDDHELGEERSTEEGVVDAGEVDNLEFEWLLAKIVWLAKGDVKTDAPEGHGFLPRDDPIEWCLAREQVALRDAHPIEGTGVEFVEAAAPSISTLVRHVVPMIGMTMSG